MKPIRLAVLAALPCITQPALAAHWTVDYAKSRLGFTVQWSNEPFSGTFKKWNADIDFDPANLAQAHASVDVDLASEESDEPDFDSGLKGAQGFATSQFPTAHFVTKSFVQKAANAYVARGSLTLHGVSQDITLPFTLTMSGRRAHIAGSAHVLRSDFGLGHGAWAASTPVSQDVTINIDLTAIQ